MTTTTKAIKKQINSNIISNGFIDIYKDKTKDQLIQEIKQLKRKVIHFEELSDQRELRKRECIKELKCLLEK